MWRILTASLGAGRVSGHRTIGVVIILGAVVGIVWHERGLSLRAAFGKARRSR